VVVVVVRSLKVPMFVCRVLWYHQDGSLCWNFDNKYHSLKGVRSVKLDAITDILVGKQADAFGKKTVSVLAVVIGLLSILILPITVSLLLLLQQ